MNLSIVTKDTVQGLQAEIPTFSLAFKVIQKANGLNVVLKRQVAMF